MDANERTVFIDRCVSMMIPAMIDAARSMMEVFRSTMSGEPKNVADSIALSVLMSACMRIFDQASQVAKSGGVEYLTPMTYGDIEKAKQDVLLKKQELAELERMWKDDPIQPKGPGGDSPNLPEGDTGRPSDKV